ncbi:polysaccharide biosynthesis C-terminal domain-containing protein [Flavivirga aquimarina]|uniref:Polysaccharide biosynthesis C-terminal domain-containing protein n=1 Tax=Flavivirga aquimarina TaxID=2027862 RepID=A0ABT8WDE7_9FLAO|nr:polysaccharide biosynthesis C-terminal domain-containing protein [Flavivirga aquimarina]MDO5971170.1 polysaccharide biosynthesis C-terminal domain-containing protein [Flavivirga aquimarina]
MGIVASQSFKNVISTYLGFLIGAINTLFLYTKFLSDEYYGMVGYMLSLAYVIMPLMAFGAHNTLVKFYSSFKTRISLNSFLTLMLFLPFLITIPLSVFSYLCYDMIGDFLSQKNDIIKGYVWHVIIIALALAYFEVFFAWAKVQMQTVFGNFMKEVFHRVGTMILLFLLYLKIVDVEQFMIGLVCVYVLRMFVMNAYAFSVKLPVITFKRINGLSDIFKYSFLIIIAGSIATIFLDVDKVMLGHYIEIEEIAYYNVAVFIAAVIAVPQRSMQQILMPLSAKYLNERDFDALGDLYKKSSLNLFIIAGFIFLLIVLNINQLYYIIPEEFSGGLFVVLIISVSKLYDALLGSNNAILFNSNYYRAVLYLGVVLVILMIVLNIVFIPLFGINGAALATFLAIFAYNSIKLLFVYKKFKIHPFTGDILRITGLISLCVLLFYFWEFPFNTLINIALKSTLITVSYVFVVYRFKFSEDITMLIKRYLKIK